MTTHYGETIEPGIIAGKTPASLALKQQVISTIITDAYNAGLDAQDTATLIAMARVESNYNPYAANRISPASGVFQFVDITGSAYGLDSSNRFSIYANVQAGVDFYSAELFNGALRLDGDSRFDQFTFAEKVYAYHHEGAGKSLDHYLSYLNNEILDKDGNPTFQDQIKSGLINAYDAASSILTNQTNPDGSTTVNLLNSGETCNLSLALFTGIKTCAPASISSSFIETETRNWDPTSTQYALGQIIGYQVIAKDASGNVTYDTYLTADGVIAQQIHNYGAFATITQGDISITAIPTTDPNTGAITYVPTYAQVTGYNGTFDVAADGTFSIPATGGNFTVALPSISDPMGTIAISAGGQTLSVPAGSSIQLAGNDLQIQNPAVLGSDNMQIAPNGNYFQMHINPDNSYVVDSYDASTGVHSQTTTDAAGNTFQINYNTVSGDYNFNVNGVPQFDATLSGGSGSGTLTGGSGNDILIGGTGTITAIVDGKEVVFDVTRTGDNLADPASIQITGIESVGGSTDPATIAAVNDALLAKGYTMTDLAGGNSDIKSLVAAADQYATPEEQIVKANTNTIPSASFAEWMGLHGAELTMGLNGLGALIKSLDSHSLSDQIHGALWLSTAISNYNNPQSGLSNNLGQVGHIASWLDAVQSLRTRIKGVSIAIKFQPPCRVAHALTRLQSHSTSCSVESIASRVSLPRRIITATSAGYRNRLPIGTASFMSMR